MTTIQNPQLYARNYCGYCYRVMHAIKSLDIDVKLVDIWADDSNRETLINATGSSRVPVLRYENADGDEVWLAESNEIISLLPQFSA
jgi:glutathione S-transferase